MNKRMKTKDVAFNFRMGAGFPGAVNRSHPASIEPVLISSTKPPTRYGIPVLIDSTNQGVRPYEAADQSNTVASGYGITVRAFPTQQSSASNYGEASIGTATPPTSGTMDVLRAGYIMVNLPAGGSPKKGDPVFVWATASAGANIQGTIVAAASAGNTTPLAFASFNGTPDANGNVEIEFNV